MNLWKLTVQFLNWEFGIIVRTECVWLEVITGTLPPATELTQALLTYLIIVRKSTFLAAEPDLFLVFMLCTSSMAQKYFDFSHERGKKVSRT